MSCEFEVDGNCQVSTLLVGINVPLDSKVCAACKSHISPMAINAVTCSRAAWAARQAKLPIPPETLNCIRDGQQEGPGTEIKKMLARLKIAEPTATCSCNARANLMNVWGPEGCEQRMDEIVGWLREEAHKKWPATKLISIDWAIKKLIRKAIQRANRKMLRNQSKNTTR